MRGFGFMRAMALVAMALPAAAVSYVGVDLFAPVPVSSNARKRARRAALVASGYSLRRSKGAPARRKIKPNRLHVSRRAKRRHRRARRQA